MAKKYLDYDGLLYFWQKLKTYFVPQTRTINGKALSANVTLTASDVSALPDSTTIPSPGTGSSYPTMNGTRALGTNAGYARVDHVHPSDTSRVPTTRKVNGHALSADVSVTASDIGVEPGAEVNIIETVKVNGTALTVTDKAVDVTVPTKTSDLTNDSDFVSDASYVHTDNNFTTTLKNKLDGIETGAEVNVVDNVTSPTSGGMKVIDIFVGSNIFEAISVDAKGVANGIASLDSSGKVPSSQLPSYVDDVIEAYPRSGQTELSSTWLATGSASGTVITPEAGKIYVLMADSTSYATNTQFRWGGTAYVKLADGGVSSITNAEIDTIVAA